MLVLLNDTANKLVGYEERARKGEDDDDDLRESTV